MSGEGNFRDGGEGQSQNDSYAVGPQQQFQVGAGRTDKLRKALKCTKKENWGRT